MLSNVMKYIEYSSNLVDDCKLNIVALKPKNHKRIYNMLEEDGR